MFDLNIEFHIIKDIWEEYGHVAHGSNRFDIQHGFQFSYLLQDQICMTINNVTFCNSVPLSLFWNLKTKTSERNSNLTDFCIYNRESKLKSKRESTREAFQRCLASQYCVNCKGFAQENLRFSAEMQDGAFSLITLKHAEHNVFH